MKRIAIIGGGISGLSAAFALEECRRTGAALEYVVYEASARLGGVLQTERVEGCLVEAGPDSFLTEKPWAADLCRRIGLADDLIGSNDAQRRTYILVGRQLVLMPDGLMFMVPTRVLPVLFSPLFSAGTKLRMAREWFYPRRKVENDETVAALVERHYGPEMVDRLADPLLSGVYGGEASQLSVRAVLPRFAEMESNYGSLGRGMMAARAKARPRQSTLALPLFTSLHHGMQQLTDALITSLSSSSLHVKHAVQSVEPYESGWLIASAAGLDKFDALVIAVPAKAAADLLQHKNAMLAAELRGIDYSSSVTVTLGYGPQVRASLPPGFGFLVPRSEGRRMLAATFVHNKFPHRAPDDRALIRCFLGGARNEPILQSSEEEIVQIVRQELQEILELTAEPRFARVFKWKGAMAQYKVGHLERLQRIEHLRQQLPGLALAGNAYRGIGVPDCVRSGGHAAAQALAAVGFPQTARTPVAQPL